jgi:flagellar motor switch protein FliG
MTPLQKLAGLLTVLGEPSARVMLKHFPKSERELIAAEMANLPRMDLEQQTAILREFTEMALQIHQAAEDSTNAPEIAATPDAAQILAEQQAEPIFQKGHDAKELDAAKSEPIRSDGLFPPEPERISIEVLKQFIRENPGEMRQTARHWFT